MHHPQVGTDPSGDQGVPAGRKRLIMTALVLHFALRRRFPQPQDLRLVSATTRLPRRKPVRGAGRWTGSADIVERPARFA